jgi:hypothetical protein
MVRSKETGLEFDGLVKTELAFKDQPDKLRSYKEFSDLNYGNYLEMKGE